MVCILALWFSTLTVYTQNHEERKHFTEKKELGCHLNARYFTVFFRTSQGGNNKQLPAL